MPQGDSSTPILSFRDLEAGYGRHTVLHDISAVVKAGECVAITGNNGSGKSTLVKTLVNIKPVNRGSVYLFGYTREAGGRASGPLPWSRVGYVPQRLTATGGVDSSVSEVVQAGLLRPGRLGMPRSWRTQVARALEQVGMAHRSNERFSVLSGGQQQRCLIARALIRDPELLILDEPLTGLDAHNRKRLAEIVATHLEGGNTALIVLHELGELRDLITREIRLSSGHIVHDGPCTHTSHRDQAGPWIDEDCAEAHVGKGH